MRRLFFIATLALLFSLGQQAVAVHAIAHLAEQQETHNNGKPPHQVCDKCVVYAGLAAAVASSALWIPPADLGHALLLGACRIVVPPNASFHFSARAPPPALS